MNNEKKGEIIQGDALKVLGGCRHHRSPVCLQRTDAV